MRGQREQSNYPPEWIQARADEIEMRRQSLSEQIAAAAERAGRDATAVEVVAVTKTHGVELMRAAWAAGLRRFGENRVQEALGKMDELGELPARWHLIGHLQRNKVKHALGRFELIHSVDSVRLIEELERRAAEAEQHQRILLQLNVSGEASKFGAPPEQLEALLEALEGCEHVHGEGLMTIPPLGRDAEWARPYFIRLRELLGSIEARRGFTPRHLSMGMSGDFVVAVEEGATLVRIGTALLGARP